MSILSCNKGEKLRDFYLSQPRDKNLFGWWNESFDIPDRKEKIFMHFTDGERKIYSKMVDGKLEEHSQTNYWYTKDGLLMTCRVGSWIYGHDESKYEYKISNDTLYERFPGSNEDMRIWAIRTQSPL